MTRRRRKLLLLDGQGNLERGECSGRASYQDGYLPYGEVAAAACSMTDATTSGLETKIAWLASAIGDGCPGALRHRLPGGRRYHLVGRRHQAPLRGPGNA